MIAQALACGLPVITTRQTSAAQLMIDGQNDYVLESRDVDGLVDRLRLLARDESLLQRFNTAAPPAVARLGFPNSPGMWHGFTRACWRVDWTS